MLTYDWMWWGQLTNQNLARRCKEVRGGVHGGARRCVDGCMEVHRGVCGGVRRCAEVHGGMRRCVEGCTEVHGGARRCAEVHGGVRGGAQRGVEGCAEVFQRGGGEKNQDFMLIRFLNAGI